MLVRRGHGLATAPVGLADGPGFPSAVLRRVGGGIGPSLYGSRVVLIRGPAQVDRLFELVGVSERLEIVAPESLDRDPDPRSDRP